MITVVRDDLPTGTVTFLFTDVEGSTALLTRVGSDAYGKLLAEHHRLIRTGVADAGGREVDTQGEAFFAAFPSATGAVAAAARLQRELTAAGLAVRIGLHTGQPPLLSGVTTGQLRVCEQMPVRLAWILDQDRELSILDQERAST